MSSSKVTVETAYVCGHSLITQIGTEVGRQRWRVMKVSKDICEHCHKFNQTMNEGL